MTPSNDSSEVHSRMRSSTRTRPSDPTCSGSDAGQLEGNDSIYGGVTGANHGYPEASEDLDTARASEEPEDEFTKACRHKGRWINVAICFGIDLQDIFRLGIRFDRGNFAAYNDGDNNDDDDDDDSICDIKDEEKGFILTAYKAILDLIPKLKRFLPIEDDTDPDYFYKIVNAMQAGCNMARSEAIRRIKDNTVRYLTAGRTPIRVDPNWQVTDKALHGLNDPVIGRLLIPAEDLLEWDADPEVTRAAFSNGNMKICGTDMPVFLYDNYRYNPEDPEEGLFQGPFLVCVLLDILFGTNSVDTTNVKRLDQLRRHCVGEMYELKTITPQNIAYAAVLARFCLSSKRTWGVKDDCFNYSTFYQAIIMRLTDHEDPWVQTTLSWWNDRVFGNENGKVTTSNVATKDSVKWRQFVRRRAGRKAATKAMEARRQVMAASAPTPGATDSLFDAEGLPPSANGNETETANRVVPSTPPFHSDTAVGPSTPSQPDHVIDPSLLDTPDLDSSMLTQTPQGPPMPQTPDACGPPARRNSSPLSSPPEVSTSGNSMGLGTAEDLPRVKRKRQASKTERPKTKAAPRARKKGARS